MDPGAPAGVSKAHMLLYASATLISAFLVFQVQPIMARIILPWFGGSAAVWTTCLVFFQTGLLLGYVYAHCLFRYCRPRVQAVLHCALLAASLAILPVMPDAAWKPGPGQDPGIRILGLLAASVGLPYLLLSSTGPLLQAWYSRRYKHSVPYRLYALSNAGSMFALVSYPLLFEPLLTSSQQAQLWSAAYAVFLVLCAAAAVRFAAAADARAATLPRSPAPQRSLYVLWILLPACASVLLLSITTHLSQNVAAIPFLWVLPLSLYLLSFILCFEGGRWYARRAFLLLMPVALTAMAYFLARDVQNSDIKLLIPVYACGLFVCCMVCHGELARIRPAHDHLTAFYVSIASGGALGGLLVGVAAPRLFNGYHELRIGMAGCALAVLVLLRSPWGMPQFRTWRSWGSVLGSAFVAWLSICLILQTRQAALGTRAATRDFYGVLRVKDDGNPNDLDSTRSLMHGTISHGTQFTHPLRWLRPTTYYGPPSGVGRAMLMLQKHGPVRVGVVGLGAGTLAAYGRPGDYFRFYEISPAVLRMARTYFTFLSATPARVEVALGDARMSLESEPPQNFDLLVVDAFSSDAIPVHLLTGEAFLVYRRHLKAGGIIAVHVSNRYLDLFPVVRLSADAIHEEARALVSQDQFQSELYAALWALVAPEPVLNSPDLGDSYKITPGKGVRLWTDQYSNVLRFLR